MKRSMEKISDRINKIEWIRKKSKNSCLSRHSPELVEGATADKSCLIIVVELKAIQNLSKEHEVQLVNYLNGMQKELGLLLNFGPSGVQVKRKYRQYSPQNAAATKKFAAQRDVDWAASSGG